MVGLSFGTVVVLLALAYFVSWIVFYICSWNYKQVGGRDKSPRQVEQQKLKERLKSRSMRADVLAAYIENPKNTEAIKSLLLKELAVATKMKGTKRRMISELKYAKIKEAAETGKFNDEVLDFLNSK